MAYAQTAYNEILGATQVVNGKSYNPIYTIAEIGCFVTAFSNLLDRYGEGVAPDALNNYFRDHGDYLDIGDPGLDGVGWGTISAYDGNIHPVRVIDHGTEQTAGWPSSNDAIVKFRYQSHRTGEWTTHFCLVADAAAHTIVDSWDGKVKPISATWYGEPVAFAEYQKNAPAPVAPIQPAAPAPAAVAPAAEPFTVENITPKQIRIKVDTNKWNLGDTTWSSFRDNPVEHVAGGTVETAVAIAHHKLGGDYYMTNASEAAGFNVVDCEDYTPPAPDPAPVTVVPAPVTVVPAPGATPEAPAAAAASDETHIPVTVKPATLDQQYHYKELPQVTDFTSNLNVRIHDVQGLLPDQQLETGMLVKVKGEFEHEGVQYWRTEKSVANGTFYGVPKYLNGVQTLTAVTEAAVDRALDVVLHYADDIRRDMGIFTKHEKNVNVGAKLAGSVDGFLHRRK